MEDMLEAGLLAVHGVDPKESFLGRSTASGWFNSIFKFAFHLESFGYEAQIISLILEVKRGLQRKQFQTTPILRYLLQGLFINNDTSADKLCTEKTTSLFIHNCLIRAA